MNTPHSTLQVRADSCSSAEEMKKATPTVWSKASVGYDAPTKGGKPCRLKVSFNEKIVVRRITHLNDISEEEIADVWYKKAEYQSIRAEFISTVRKIIRGEYSGDTDRHCMRGLEFKTPLGATRRKENKMNALAAVLDEQDRQYNENDFNLEGLACVYIQCNIASRREATRMGEADAEEASGMCQGKGNCQRENRHRTRGGPLRRLFTMSRRGSPI